MTNEATLLDKYASEAFAGLVAPALEGVQVSPAQKTEFDLGPASNYPLNSRTLLSDPPAVLLHTEDGFSALSLVCTHLGCGLENDAQGFACPGHGSRFDVDGKVIHGPADTHLQSLRVEVTDEGNLKLFTA